MIIIFNLFYDLFIIREGEGVILVCVIIGEFIGIVVDVVDVEYVRILLGFLFLKDEFVFLFV